MLKSHVILPLLDNNCEAFFPIERILHTITHGI